MSGETYNTILYVVSAGVMIALVGFVSSLGMMILRWNTDKRRGHVIRLLASIAGIVMLAATLYVVQIWIFLPSLARKQLAEYEAARAKLLADSSVVHVGDPAPDFSLTTINDQEFSLADARGDVLLINFFATWCGPCRMESPHIQQIWEERKQNPHFRLLVIGREETKEKVQQFCAANNFTFPAAPDVDGKVYFQFAKEYIPRTLIISPEGKIVYSQMGFDERDLQKLRETLDQQLAQVPDESQAKPAE
ncbi:Thiol-disulfide oxidoreductase ResA [Gimesia panareensis]|uniref:Thiol-disulfide oxidoreductase ResA n=1 Tax=Gimesia panareensis TaxID=2527978 RepID=A0A517Q9X0_9PLAN|nr:TlpA disulfide reductase family protein [Gimesia panareensis]QDT28423.1 Thiol-disulfide oxidoreductase ResA [Gimesia panareensis]